MVIFQKTGFCHQFVVYKNQDWHNNISWTITFLKLRNDFYKIRLSCVHFAVDLQHCLQPFCFLLSKNYLFLPIKTLQ